MKDIKITIGKDYRVDIVNDIVVCTVTPEQVEKAFSSELEFNSFIFEVKNDIQYKSELDAIREAIKLCSEHKII